MYLIENSIEKQQSMKERHFEQLKWYVPFSFIMSEETGLAEVCTVCSYNFFVNFISLHAG